MLFDFAGFAEKANVAAPECFVEKCEFLRCFLEEVNKEINLTRITGKTDFELKHAADSLLLPIVFPELTTRNLKIADIGCGAGFPSLILALAFPHWQISAIDSIGKKIKFVQDAATLLGLKNISTIHGRSVELNCKKEFQNRFDIVTARAVAPTPKIYKEANKFIRRNGRYIFYKTPLQAAEEEAELKKTNSVSWHNSAVYTLPGDAGERLFTVGTTKK